MRTPSLETVHGFRVDSCGRPLSRDFKRALRRLRERGFDDPTCVVVKTPAGPRSGVTHAGGRYVHAQNPYAVEVTRAMRDQGLEPPPPPFVLAPGPLTLYHEWGHHVDRIWSREDQELLFSFRWFSRFFEIGALRASRTTHAAYELREGVVPIESEGRAGDATLMWWKVSSELFANLFEDWMRAEKRVSWDHCDPEDLNSSHAAVHLAFRIALRLGVQAEDVRAETYALFSGGIRSPIALPRVRSDLFGVHTARVLDRFRGAMRTVRRERRPYRDDDAA